MLLFSLAVCTFITLLPRSVCLELAEAPSNVFHAFSFPTMGISNEFFFGIVVFGRAVQYVVYTGCPLRWGGIEFEKDMTPLLMQILLSSSRL